MQVKYLTTDEIIEIHDKIIEKSGGHSGIISYGNLDFVVDQSKIPKSLDRIATVLFYGILTGHPFVDGNKRTGTIVVDTILKRNGKEFVAKDDEIWTKVQEISTGKLKFEEVVNWIKGNMM